MNKHLTYRNVLRGSGILVLLGYLMFFNIATGAWDSFQQAKDLISQKKVVFDSDELLSQQDREILTLKGKAAQYRSSTLTLHNHLEFVDYLEANCRDFDLRIVAIPTEKRESWEEHVVSEERIRLQGSFSNILSMLYQIEYKDKVGSIQHVNFGRQKIRKQGKNIYLLFADVKLKRLNHSVAS